jgi:hypothetical protein
MTPVAPRRLGGTPPALPSPVCRYAAGRIGSSLRRRQSRSTGLSLASAEGRMPRVRRMEEDKDMNARGFGRPSQFATQQISPGVELDVVGALALLGGGAAHGVPQTGFKRLMLAVLEDGIRCYFSKVPRIRTEAEVWIGSGRRVAFSFEVICDLFGIDPGAARAALRRLRDFETRPRMLRQRHRGTSRRLSLTLPC